MAHFYSDALERPAEFNFARDVIDYWAERSPNLRAMRWVSQDGSRVRELDFAHFSRESRRVAALFGRLGIKRGERAVIILPRISAWWEIAIGCLRAGVILCPATTLLVEKDIEYRCQVSNASVFIGDEESVRKVMKVKGSCPSLRHVLHVSSVQGDKQTSLPSGVFDFDASLKDVPLNAKFETVRTTSTDPAMIYFTSGTSGPPKMVQHNATSYPLAHVITGKHWLQLRPGQLYWNLSEQGWAKAAWSFFGAWNCGAALFVQDDRGPFRAENMIHILHTHPITTLCAPPTAYRQLVLGKYRKLLAATPPLTLQHCTGAGEPLNDEVIKIWQRMTGMTIRDGYGQTETILVCGNFADFEVRPGSMGKPTPGVNLLVLDDELKEAGSGVEGSLGIMLGDGRTGEGFFGVFDGYIGSDGKLVRKVQVSGAGTGDEKRWYLTGDRAYRDEDGYLWFVGRADDVINSAGYRIGPFEVESTLKQHPAVAESAVIAAPDESRGEVVKAFVVLTDEYAQSDREALGRELQDFCKKNAAPYKYPRRVEFVDASFLPKTISGKIKRGELKKAEWKGWGAVKAKL